MGRRRKPPIQDVAYFDEKRQELFLQCLKEIPNVSRACRLARVERHIVYTLKKNDESFSEQWESAINEGLEGLEESAWEVAKAGDRGMITFLLKAHRPEVYGDRYDITSGGKPLGPSVFLPDISVHQVEDHPRPQLRDSNDDDE